MDKIYGSTVYEIHIRMYIFVLLTFTGLSVLSYKCNKSLIEPSFITSALWAFLIFVYNFIPHGLYPVSDKFYWAITLWVVPFCLSCLFFSKVNFKVSKYLTNRHPTLQFSTFVLFILIGIYVVLILELMKLSREYGDGGILYGVRSAFLDKDRELPGSVNLLMYLATIGLTLTIANLYTHNSQRFLCKLLILLQFFFLICLGNKGGLANFGFAILFLNYYYGKLNVKKIVGFALVFIILMTVVTLFRQGDDTESSATLAEFILIYTLSPLPAFDMILNSQLNIVYGTPGSATFESVIKLFTALGIDLGVTPHYADSWWVGVPLATNVFTHMATFYLDFGYAGIFFFALFFGSSWGILYNLMKRKIQLFVVIYAIFFYTLFLTFFADYVFTFLSLTLQYILISHLLFIKFRIYGRLSGNHSDGHL